MATEAAGREDALAAMKNSVDLLERKADSRETVGEPGVSENGDCITLTYSVRYTKAGLDDFTLVGKELIEYENGLIKRMEDIFDNTDAIIAWRSDL